MKIQMIYCTQNCFEISKTQVIIEGTKVDDYRKTAHAHLHLVRMMTND